MLLLDLINLDRWSARRNLEVTVSMLDPPIALALKEQFHKDRELSHEIDAHAFSQRSFIRRFICWFCYLILRL